MSTNQEKASSGAYHSLDLSPHDQDYSGLQAVDHGGLEVVPGSELPLQQQQEQQQQQYEKAPGYVGGPYDASAAAAVGQYNAGSQYTDMQTPNYGYDQGGFSPAYGQPNPYLPPPPVPPSNDPHGAGLGSGPGCDRIWGIRRPYFWVILSLTIFFVVIAVALGVGLGVGLDSGQSSSSSATSTSGTLSLPAATATSTAGPELDITCPANNETLFVDPTTNKRYILLCGLDYNSQVNPGNKDMYDTPQETMADCISLCASQSGCVGAGYGNYDNAWTCWLKSALVQSSSASDWMIAVEDDSHYWRP